jgi:hypothetical protein
LCKIFLGMLSIGACLNFMRMGVIWIPCSWLRLR